MNRGISDRCYGHIRYMLLNANFTTAVVASRRRLISTAIAKTSFAPVPVSYSIYEPPAGKIRKIPIFMTHGLLGSKLNWNAIAKATARDALRKVICFDARNHGESPHHEDISYDVMADDILQLAQDLGIDRFSLLGHSMGGRTAMVFALKYPEKIEKLIIVDVSPFSMAGEFKQMRAFLEKLISIKFDTPLALSEARKIADEMLATVTEDPGLRAFLLTNLARNAESEIYWRPNLEALLRELKELKKFPDNLFSSKFEAPALFIRGEHSFYIPDSDVDKIHKIFINAEIATIENSSHWPQADNPNKFLAALVKFLNM